ncbi:ML1 [Symbiodinium sp. CCMP2592]|nr:ML1 [Symbiodinium sp. CCMP2592]
MDPPGLAELASPWHPWRFHLPDLSPNGPEVNPMAPRPPAPFAEARARLAQVPAVGVVGAPVGGRDLGEVNVPRVPIGGPEIARPEELGETAGSSSETSTACTALFKEDSGELDPSEEPVPPTTIMMRNIPSEFSGYMLLQLLNKHGFKGSYDLVYLPMDYHNKVGFGYAFINFVDATQAERFRYAFEGFHDWGVVSEKVRWLPAGDWVKDHLTKYADDSHLRWRFQSFEQFEAIMQEVCQVFVCFRKFHMKINLEKSKAILKMVGTLKHKVRKDFIRKTNAGHRLLLSPRNPDKWLTLVQSTEYLGAIVSYQQFELQTLRHRISKANARRWALASFLHSRRISVKLKLRIWQSSVLSSLLYGLSTCGLTGGQVEDIQRVIMKHVRAIISNQAHLTGDKHEVIIRRYHIPLAADLLQAELDRAGAAQAQHADWMYEAEWQMHLQSRLQTITAPPSQDTETATWACPACESIFNTQSALKWHARRMHGIVDERATFDKTLHSVRGLPICRFCEKKFSRWQTLADHITKRRSAEPVSAFDELEDFFGEVKAEGQATNKRRKPEPDRSYRPTGQLGRADPLVLSLARAVVRQEEELKVLKQDHSIVMWLRPGEYGILHHLYVTAKAFKQKQQVRVNKVLADETLQKKAADMGWRDPATGWRNPLTDQQVLQAFKMLYTSLDQDTVTRFSCTRKVTETMANQATFLMDISVRTPAAMEAWKTMHMLQGCSVLQLGGMAYRRDTLKCSPLVEKIKVLCWLLHRDPDRLASLGRCAQFLNGLKNGSFEKSHNLLNNFLWRLLLRGWTDVQRQHDVIEFAAHINNKHELQLFQGQWETRKVFEGVPSAIEMGLTTQPLQLYMPELPPGLDAPLSIQRLMDHWMHHDGVSAFTVAPSILLLQIDRFQNVRGRISKRMEAVNIGGKLRVPLFTGIGMGIRIIPYRLTAYITHFGMHPQSGHNVCTLVQEAVHWRCDDERTAVQGNALSFEHASNVYMLIYEQTDVSSHDV